MLGNLSKELQRAAQLEWESALKEYTRGSAGLERAYLASKRVMDATAGDGPATHKADAAKSHFDRMLELARLQLSNPTVPEVQTAQVKAYAAEAELWLAQTRETIRNRSRRSPSSRAPGEAGTRRDDQKPEGATRSVEGRGNDLHSRRIIEKLDERITMSFSEDTPLEDVLKYIKQSTTTPTYPGIPIYVDPVGLQEADKSMTSTVKNLDLEGVPLRRTLQLLLRQLDLIYFVEDGMLYITSEQSDGPLPPAMRSPSPIMEKIEKAERGELNLSEMKDADRAVEIPRAGQSAG